MSPTQNNPYIGPRTFKRDEGHLFFGREREARDLIALVASEKLVLFYAQSGAGKSSIVNTRLIPNLEKKDYEVLPVGRVGGDLPAGNEVDNVYVYNLINGLVQQKADPQVLSKLSLAQFLAGLNIDDNGYFFDSNLFDELHGTDLEGTTPIRRALIIDQFEELLSTHPEAWEKREDFFVQLAQAMQEDPYLWVVLVMREDYIAALDPYAHQLPGGLRVRYYMQRLSREAALIAMRSPVEKLRPYAEGVAEKLVEDLSSIKVYLPDGTTDLQPGQYIEPVQLQVVCHGLWQNLPKDGTQITEKDLLEVGDVDDALGKYFAGRIAGVASAKKVKERIIRGWIEKKLIAPGGIRNIVLQDSNPNSEVSDDVIQALQSDLVRAEKRGGATWYELTHDRLVGPILTNNKKWFDENLSPLQRQATLWNDQGRNESWLLRDQALVEVEKWAGENKDEITDLESEFLEACRHQQEQYKLKEQANSARRAVRFTIMAFSLSFIAIVAAGVAISQSIQASTARKAAENNAFAASTAQAIAEVAQSTAQASEAEALLLKQRAEKAAAQALAGNLAAQADSQKNSDYRLALLLGLEAYQRDDSLLTRTTLFQLLQFTPYTRRFGFNGAVGSVAVSPDGSIVAVASCKNQNDKRQCTNGGVDLYNTALDKSTVREITGDLGVVYSLAFHQYPDMLVLAAAGCIPANERSSGCLSSLGQITLWEIPLSLDQEPKKLFSTLDDPKGKMHTGLVKTVAFSHDGALLASGSNDTTLILWDMSNPAHHPVIKGKIEKHTSFVNSVAFAPDDKTLVSASDDTTIRLWNVSNPEQPTLISYAINGHRAPVTDIAFSPDGTTFASSSIDNQVILWKWTSSPASLDVQKILKGHTGYVTSIAFSPDGNLLASAGFDNSILLWNTGQGEQVGPPLNIHSGAINSIAFGDDKDSSTGLYLISGSDDSTLIKWDLSSRQPISHTFEQEPVLTAQQLETKNNKYAATVSGQQIDVNNLLTGDSFFVITDFNTPVDYVGFEADKLDTIDQIQRLTEWVTEWTIDPENWTILACNAVKRNLTDSEWAQYLPNQTYQKTCAQYP